MGRGWHRAGAVLFLAGLAGFALVMVMIDRHSSQHALAAYGLFFGFALLLAVVGVVTMAVAFLSAVRSQRKTS